VNRSLRGGTYNCKAGRVPADVADDVRFLLAEHRLHFLLLQEANHYTAQLSVLPGYRLVIHDKCGTAILVHDETEAKFAHVTRLGLIRWPYRRRGHPLRWHPRRALCAVLLDGWLHAASVHMHPDPEHSIIRDQQYDLGMRRLRRWANNRPALPLVIAGDWNKPGRNMDPLTPRWLAANIGADLEYIVGHVDYPIVRKCQIANLRTGNKGGSDHAPVLFTITRKASS